MKNNTYENDVRILGGKFKGKLLPVLDVKGLRPTPSRVRETIFSWIRNSIDNAKVLDLFAGSGALGFEAYSRGAAKVTLIELDKDNSSNLKEIAKSMSTENIHVINDDALHFLDNTNTVFDIVFIDPPYKLNIYEDVLKKLLDKNLINDNSLIYVEMRNGSNKIVPGYEIIKEENAGQSKYSLWTKSKLLF
ncbi:MAG: 16S rRNA (guanine(966)-N(2))-methyltransferase RsmD [Succinivibrio sp.]|nr:16S rRNA (guanine(966)-N(2))-methyltransferase RsmD [Succinivibrio sp.]